jgi:antirestriction protein ArdC
MNIYQTITDRILSQIDKGHLPWRRSWQGGLPASLATQREYRGINILALSASEFSSRYWLTFREALRLGGHVRKGEKATTVVFWKWRTPEELEAAKRNGQSVPSRCVPFTSSVFNLDQVEGVERPKDDIQHRDHQRLEVAEQMLDVMPDMPEVCHGLLHHPAYECAADRILLPHLSQFESADSYFATLFHEVVHATGHPNRLDRFCHEEGTRIEKYSFEELVAEVGAAFVCGFCGIRNPVVEQLQESYIAGWAEVFRKDSRILLRAASAAQRAADYIRGKVFVESDTEHASLDQAVTAC